MSAFRRDDTSVFHTERLVGRLSDWGGLKVELLLWGLREKEKIPLNLRMKPGLKKKKRGGKKR